MFNDDFDTNEDRTLQIAKERELIKEKMKDKLDKLGFNDTEINSVIQIIDITEAKISTLKSSLIGTNINNDDPTPIMAHVISQIKQLQIDMAEDIKKRVDEILTYKKNK